MSDAQRAYEADRIDGVSPPWESLGPETRQAYEEGAPRYTRQCGWYRNEGDRE